MWYQAKGNLFRMIFF